MLSGINPFKLRNKTRQEKLDMILEEEIPMQPQFSEVAVSLLTSLLMKKPKERLGYNGVQEIKDHEFFETIDWAKLASKNVRPPFKPRVLGDDDISNIDRVIPLL